MRTISREQLKSMMDQGRKFSLVEVLGPESYAEYHLPGATNVPLGEDFGARIQGTLPDKNRPVVVYCKDAQCTASPTAAKQMDELGYQQVFDYEAGKVDWKQAGLPVE